MQLGVLGQLAEQPQRAVLEVAERAVGAHRAPVAVELGQRVGREVDRGEPGEQAGVGELRDLGGQQRARRVGVALVPAAAGLAAEAVPEPGEVRGLGEVRRRGREQRPAMVAERSGVDPAGPGAETGAVGRLVAGLLPEGVRVGGGIEQALVGEHGGGSAAQPEPLDLLGHGVGNREQAVRQPAHQRRVTPEHRQRHIDVAGAWAPRSTSSAGAGSSTPSTPRRGGP